MKMKPQTAYRVFFYTRSFFFWLFFALDVLRQAFNKLAMMLGVAIILMYIVGHYDYANFYMCFSAVDGSCHAPK